MDQVAPFPGREQPRVLLLSQRALKSNVARCMLHEFEDVVRGIESAALVAPHYARVSRATRAVRKLGRRLLKSDLVPKSRIAPVTLPRTERYSLLFAYFATPGDLSVLDSLPGWRARCQQAICWIDEAWLSRMGNYRAALKRLDRFDHVILSFEDTIPAVEKLLGVRCHYLPCAVDSLAFCPPSQHRERPIHVFWPGRRDDAAHRALMESAAQKDWLYLYDTVANPHANDQPAHRRLYADLVARSRYFIVNTAKFNEPHLSARQAVFGSRYMEGIASGAVLLGKAPDTDTFRRHFDWDDAVIEVSLGQDPAALARAVNDLDADPNRLTAIRLRNMRNALLRHDWVYRWERVLALAGLPATAQLEERKRLLAERATPFDGNPPRVLAA